MWPRKYIERTRGVGLSLCIPFKTAHADLESVHAATVVLQFLIAVLCLVKPMCFVIEAHRETTELCVYCDEICRAHRLQHKIKPLSKIIYKYFHLICLNGGQIL